MASSKRLKETEAIVHSLAAVALQLYALTAEIADGELNSVAQNATVEASQEMELAFDALDAADGGEDGD